MQHEIKPYSHFGDCLFMRNGTVEFAVPLAFGIRVLRFALCGGENVFYEQPAHTDYLCTEAGWRVQGGTRMWLAPEGDACYWPDTQPIDYALREDGVLLTQSPEGYMPIQKTLDIAFTEAPDTLRLRYGISNVGKDDLHGAPWAVSASRAGGTLRVPFAPGPIDPAPGRFLSLWGSTSLADARLRFLPDAIEVMQKPMDEYFKLGILCGAGMVSYTVDGQVFSKRFSHEAGKTYPDNNVNFEVYCCRHMMEIETLAPLGTLHPGDTAYHEEHWTLQKAK